MEWLGHYSTITTLSTMSSTATVIVAVVIFLLAGKQLTMARTDNTKMWAWMMALSVLILLWCGFSVHLPAGKRLLPLW